MSKTLGCFKLLLPGALSAGLILFTATAYAEPWISSPSSDAVDGMVELTGGGMNSGENVELRLLDTASGETVEIHLVAVGPDGGFQIDLPAAHANGMLVEVWRPATNENIASAYIAAGPGPVEQ